MHALHNDDNIDLSCIRNKHALLHVSSTHRRIFFFAHLPCPRVCRHKRPGSTKTTHACFAHTLPHMVLSHRTKRTLGKQKLRPNVLVSICILASTNRAPSTAQHAKHTAQHGQRTHLVGLRVIVIMLKVANISHPQRPKKIPAAIINRRPL